MSGIRNVAKKVFIGSPLEPLARWADFALTRNKNFLYDRQTLQVMKRTLRFNSSFVDVGCHKGSILREAIRYAPAGQHWAFEPLPHLFANLKVDFPGVHLFNVALSDSCGQTAFAHVPSNPGMSGLKLRRDLTCPTDNLTIRTATLDSIVQTNRIDMIKIDVEGAELLVLRGAQDVISRNRPVIVFEHGLNGADSYGHTPEQVFDIVSDFGLVLSTMKYWLHGESIPFSRSQFCDYYYSGEGYYFIAYRAGSNPRNG